MKNFKKSFSGLNAPLRPLAVVLTVTLVLLTQSCREVKTLTDRVATQTETVHEIIRDTSVAIRADSSMLQALLACDSVGNVLLKQILGYQAGNHLKPPAMNLNGNVMTVTAKVDSFAVYLALKDRYTEKKQIETIKETITVEVNRLTAWQKIRLWIANIALILLLPIFIHFKLKH